jgi:hypothetical protein
MRHLAPDLGRRLVLAQTLIDRLAKQIVLGPGEKLDLHNELGPHPMHAAENQGRAKGMCCAAAGDLAASEPEQWQVAVTGATRLKLGGVDAGSDAAGIDQLSIRIVIGEQQRAEIRAAALQIGSADREDKPDPNNSTAFTSPARCQADSIMD